MRLYFIKHKYTAGIYDINAFYNSDGSYKTADAPYVDYNLKADDSTTLRIKRDAVAIENYTHIIAVEERRIYEIVSYEYDNKRQTIMYLVDNPFLANYQDIKSKTMLLTRSNDYSVFTGIHDVRDTAIKHTSKTVVDTSKYTNTAGYFVLYTFQGDATEVEFTLGDLDNYPSVGNFMDLTALQAAHPDVLNANPFEHDYYLKFASVESQSELYQCVMSGSDMKWVMVNSKGTIKGTALIETIKKTFSDPNVKVVSTGDIDTVNIAFPLDATLTSSYIAKVVTNTSTNAWENQVLFYNIPTLYNIQSFTQSDKLISIKLIPQELLFANTSYNVTNQQRITEALQYAISGDDSYVRIQKTPNMMLSKNISAKTYFKYMNTPNTIQSYRTININDFIDILNFKLYTPTTVFDYEPFKKYLLSLYGEVIEIPGKYVDDLNVRISVTSTDVLYEVYTTRHNIIASGRLAWFTRYAVDQLKLFEANNPTYKEQFWTQQLGMAIKSIGGGGLLGSTKTRGQDIFDEDGYNKARSDWSSNLRKGKYSQLPTASDFTTRGEDTIGIGLNFGLGTLAGAGLTAVNLGTGLANMHFMEKGLKDKADAVFGQNDISMALIKGYGAYLIIIEPETTILNQMKDMYYISGFPTIGSKTINQLSNAEIKINGLSHQGKVISGTLLEVAKNQYITNKVNYMLQKGVVIL